MVLGNELKRLCQIAQQEIILVAPFIKVDVLKQLLNSINPEITITCVTRWLIEEITIGVSDLEVWELIKSYPQATLWLRNDLHAKYYRVDKQCLIGSANLTANALNWSNNPNFELMIPLVSEHPRLQEFEQELFNNCIKVDRQLYELYLQAIPKNLSLPKTKIKYSINNSENVTYLDKLWLPTLRNPEDLYLAYTKQWDKLTSIACDYAIKDLSVFSLPDDLNKSMFKPYIGISLLQKPMIQKIDNFVKTPCRFGAVKNFIKTLPCAEIDGFNAETSWQTLMRWLLYFLPSRYALSVPNYSEVFYRCLN